MKIERIVVGAYETNCYLLIKDDNILVIDPGDNFKKIQKHLDIYQKHVSAILLTHGHFDHIGSVDKIVETYNCDVYACQGDEKMLRNKKYNALGTLSACVSSPIIWIENDQLKIDNFNIRVLFTPGHSEGSVMYIIENNLFSGDTLFRLSVGRTDLYGGNNNKLYQSLQIIYSLDPNMMAFPGHEETTTVGFEIDNNPYLV